MTTFAAVALVSVFVKLLLSGGGSTQPAQSRTYTLPRTVSASLPSKPLPSAALPRAATAVDTELLRAAGFQRATGIVSLSLERLYASADANAGGSLSWSELAAFQKSARERFQYVANDTALRPDEFLARGGGDCEDWAELTCGLLRYWGWDPYVGCFESPSGDDGHAVCLVRVPSVPAGFTYYTIPEGTVLKGVSVAAGRYIPVDYSVVGGLTNAMDADWELNAVYTPERIYGETM